MTRVVVQMNPETERKLRHQADQSGKSLEAYLEHMAEHAVVNGSKQTSELEERYISDPRPTKAVFEKLLVDLTTGTPLPVLPADFCRADIYDDHETYLPTQGFF